MNKRNVFMIVSEKLNGSVGLGVGRGLTESGLAHVAITCAGSIPFLSSISTLITNENFSRLKIRYTKLKDWINVFTLSYEKTLRESMMDKKIDIKKAEKIKWNRFIITI